ncbi:MAG: hypothetical protein ACKVP7_08205 [Hyphomicrobiaceae bacterium]
MLTSLARTHHSDDRYLLVDDNDEDDCEILTVICDGDPRSNRGFDFDAYRNGGIA